MCLQFFFFWQVVSDHTNNLRDYQKLLNITINAAAPDGAPPWRINDENRNHPDPPCLGEALRRVTLPTKKLTSKMKDSEQEKKYNLFSFYL